MKKKLTEEEKEAMEKVTVGRYCEGRETCSTSHYSMKINSFSVLSEMGTWSDEKGTKRRRKRSHGLLVVHDFLCHIHGLYRYCEGRETCSTAHYSMKIDSFSVLSEMVDNSYESREFEASVVTNASCAFSVTCVLFIVRRKLVLYPNGDKSRNGDGYISLYLTPLVSLLVGKSMHLQVFRILQDKYLMLDGGLRRFSAIKNKWGLSQMLSLSIFNNASNGYLIGDSCVFGVEVFVIKNEGKGEHFSMIKDPSDVTFTWEVQKFSELTEEFYYSQVYLAARHKWKLKLFPNGNTKQRGKHLSLFLGLDDHIKFMLDNVVNSHCALGSSRSHHHEETMVQCLWMMGSAELHIIDRNQESIKQLYWVLNRLSVLKDFDGASLIHTVREERHVAPAHYSMKIDSFSLLSEMVDNSYESREFEASGYKKLVLYPNGDKSRNGDGYISLYLVMADTTGFSPGWEINAIFKLFVHDQLQDKYLTIGGSFRWYFYMEVQKFSELTKEFYYSQEVKALSNGHMSKGQALIFILGLDDAPSFMLDGNCLWNSHCALGSNLFV
uniref:MATH domain-containing protein n=1 Tax=Salix viminalis TaxID=40686 RepID=A0A6N2NFQ9_SALVM